MGAAYPNLGFGLGLRAPHYDQVLKEKPDIGWFEIISENYLDAHEGYREYLRDVRAHYPLVMHGVSLSIGGTDPLDRDYLRKLKNLADDLRPAWVSDHLCFTGLGGHNTHDLLPVPYTKEALKHIAARVREVQDVLGRALVLENPSTYLEFAHSDMTEWEFIRGLAETSGCGLLLDVNNVYVSAYNHGYDAKTYIDAMPASHIAQIHLAGHSNHGTHIVDTHDDHVVDAVWDLYAYTVATKGARSTMIEWDDHIPLFETLRTELDKARAVSAEAERGADALRRRA